MLPPPLVFPSQLPLLSFQQSFLHRAADCTFFSTCLSESSLLRTLVMAQLLRFWFRPQKTTKCGIQGLNKLFWPSLDFRKKNRWNVLIKRQKLQINSNTRCKSTRKITFFFGCSSAFSSAFSFSSSITGSRTGVFRRCARFLGSR